jgi:uncharacterized protein (TIGR02117 family)
MTAKTFKILYLSLKKILSWFFLLIAAYLLFATVLSVLGTRPQEKDCKKNKKVYVTTNGVHLDIILPIEDLDVEFLEQLEVMEDTKFLAFGWGDKEFYINTPQWSDLTFPTAFNALFFRSQTAMHVTSYKHSYTSWRSVPICKEQIETLINYIANSFKKDVSGKIQKIDISGYTYNDIFFESTGSFSIFKTCNVWTNNALKKSGIKTSIWSPFDFGVLYHLPE